MKILYVLATADMGGTEINTMRICEQMPKQCIACIPGDGPVKDGFVKRGLEVVDISQRGQNIMGGLKKIVKEYKPDIVHVFGFVNSMAARIVLRNTDIPCVVGIRGKGHLNGKKLLLEKITGSWVDMYMCNSLELAAALRKFGPKVKVIYNGIDCSIYSPEKKRGRLVNIGTVANIRPEKGLDMTLKALVSLKDRFDDFVWKIAGDCEYPERLEELKGTIRKYGLENHVQFLGAVADIPSFLRGIDIFVLSSRTEGCPNALLEAMASKCCCIATNVGAVGQLLDGGKAGFLVDSPEDLSHALYKVCKDMALCEEMGKKALGRVNKEFTIKGQCNQMLSLYEELIEG